MNFLLFHREHGSSDHLFSLVSFGFRKWREEFEFGFLCLMYDSSYINLLILLPKTL